MSQSIWRGQLILVLKSCMKLNESWCCINEELKKWAIQQFLTVWTVFPLEDVSREPEDNFSNSSQLQEDIDTRLIIQYKQLKFRGHNFPKGVAVILTGHFNSVIIRIVKPGSILIQNSPHSGRLWDDSCNSSLYIM